MPDFISSLESVGESGLVAPPKPIEPPSGLPQFDRIDSAVGRPEWFDNSRSLGERARSILQTNVSAGQNFDNASRQLQMIGLDAAKLEPEFKLEEARYRASKEEGNTSLEAILKIPGSGTAGKFLLEREYGRAKARIDQGQGREKGQDGAAFNDYDFVAQYERRQQLKRDQSIPAALLDTLTDLPAIGLEAAAGGGAVRAVKIGARGLAGQVAAETATSAALGRGTANVLARGAADLTARTAASPVFYLEQGARNLNEAPKDRGELQSLARAYGSAFTYGVAQNAIVGQLLTPAGAAGRTVGEVAKKTGLGMAEQQAVDVLAGAANIQSGYGLIGETVKYAQGDPNAHPLRHAATQALMFGTFAAFHGATPEKVTKAFADATQTMSKAGVPADVAAEVVDKAMAPIDAAIKAGATRAEVEKLVEQLPDGQVKQYASEVAKTVPEKPPEKPLEQAVQETTPKAEEKPPESPAEPQQVQPASPPSEPAPAPVRSTGEAVEPQKPTPPADPYADIPDAAVKSIARRLGFNAGRPRTDLLYALGTVPQGKLALSRAVAKAAGDKAVANIEKAAQPEQAQEAPRTPQEPPTPEPAPQPAEAPIARPEASQEPIRSRPADYADRTTEPEPRTAAEDLAAHMTASGLGPKEQALVQARLSGRPLEDIGREMGVSRQRAAQIEKSALRKMGVDATIEKVVLAEERAGRAEELKGAPEGTEKPGVAKKAPREVELEREYDAAVEDFIKRAEDARARGEDTTAVWARAEQELGAGLTQRRPRPGGESPEATRAAAATPGGEAAPAEPAPARPEARAEPAPEPTVRGKKVRATDNADVNEMVRAYAAAKAGTKERKVWAEALGRLEIDPASPPKKVTASAADIRAARAEAERRISAFKEKLFDKPADRMQSVVKRYGGIKWDSSFEGFYGSQNKAVKTGGINPSVFSKKGRSLDQMAQELHTAGHLRDAEPETLVEAMKGNEYSLSADLTQHYEQQLNEYHRLQEEADRAVQEAVRAGETNASASQSLSAGLQAGKARAEAEAGGHQPETAGARGEPVEPDEATLLRGERSGGEADTGFDFGAADAQVRGESESGGAADRLRTDVEASRKALVDYGFSESDVKGYEREAIRGATTGRSIARIVDHLETGRASEAAGFEGGNEQKMMADHLRKVVAADKAEDARQVASRLTADEVADDVARDALAGKPGRSTAVAAATGKTEAEPNALARAKAYVKEQAQRIFDSWYELSSRTAPRTTRIAEESGNRIARLSGADEHARRLSSVLAEEVLGPLKDDVIRLDPEVKNWPQEQIDQRVIRLGKRLMATGYEERLRHTAEVRKEQSDQLYKESVAIRAKSPEKARELYNESIQLRQQAREVKTIIGREESDLNSEKDYQDSLKSPEYKAFKERWMAVSDVMDKAYREAQGLEATEEIESLTQLKDFKFNAKAIREGDRDEASPSVVIPGGAGRLGNVKAQRLGFAQEFSGAAEGYDIDPRAVIFNSLSKSMRLAAKAEMYRQFEKDGVGQWAKPGERVEKDGVQWRVLPKVSPPKGTQAAKEGQTEFHVNPKAYSETVKVLDLVDPYAKIPGADLATNISLMAFVEGISHAKNLGTFLFKAGVNPVDFVRNTVGLLRGNPALNRRIAELAEIQATKPAHGEFGTEGPVKVTGPLSALQKGREYMGRALDTIDLAMRLTADQAFNRLVKRGTWGVKESEQNRRDFINQLGNYNRRTQHDLVRILKDTGLGPFAVAAFNYTAQGLRSAAAFSPGVTAKSWKGDIAMRAETFGRVMAVAAIAPVLNYLLWGRVDGDDKTPLGGVKVRDKDGKTGYMDLMGFTGLPRGLRSAGALALLEGSRYGASTNEKTKEARKQIIHAGTHPTAGPFTSFVSGALTGRNPIGMPVAAPVKPTDTVNNQVMADILGAIVNVSPVASTLTGMNRPTKKTSTEERIGGLFGPLAPKWSAAPPGKPHGR